MRNDNQKRIMKVSEKLASCLSNKERAKIFKQNETEFVLYDTLSQESYIDEAALEEWLDSEWEE